jgi:hypothetical protein
MAQIPFINTEYGKVELKYHWYLVKELFVVFTQAKLKINWFAKMLCPRY